MRPDPFAMTPDPVMTPEEAELHEVWAEKRVLVAGAEEAVRFANIALGEAREAAHLAGHNYLELVRRNEAAVAECFDE